MYFKFGNSEDASKVGALLPSALPIITGNRRNVYNVEEKAAKLEVASIVALRKGKKGIWKDCYLVLKDGSGPQLFVYESEKKAKTKEVLDLSRCILYKIGQSAAHRTNCVFISSTDQGSGKSACLSFLSYCDFAQWYGYLKERCFGCPRLVSSGIVPSISLCSTSFIRLNVDCYRGEHLSMKLMYSVSVSVNGINVTQTIPVRPMANDYISFNASSLIERIPSGPCNLQLQLVPHMINGKQQAPKHPLQGTSFIFPLFNDGNELCVTQKQGFSFSAVQYNVAVLPEQSYSPLLALLKSDSFSFCLRVGNMLHGLNRRHFARNLLTLFLPDPSLFLSFIDTVLEAGLRSEAAPTLFHHNTFCSICISTALNILGKDLVLDQLSPLLQHIDSGKYASTDLDAFVVSLQSLIPRLPCLFRSVLARVSQAVLNRFPEDPWCAKQAASYFFLIRFVNSMLPFWNVTEIG